MVHGIPLVDGREIAVQNELNTLKAVNHFGHLRIKEVAAYVWSDSPSKSSYIMAHRTVRRLLKLGLLINRLNAFGEYSYVLTHKGANHLTAHNITSHAGYNLNVAGTQFFHRTLGTNFLISQVTSGYQVFSEFSILTGRSPLSKDFLSTEFKKLPDGILIHRDSLLNDVILADWVEVESAYKSYGELKKALNLFNLSPELTRDGNVLLNKLYFIYDKNSNHEMNILRHLRRFLLEETHLSEELVTPHIMLASCTISRPFRWIDYEIKSASELLRLRKEPDSLEDSNLLFPY